MRANHAFAACALVLGLVAVLAPPVALGDAIGFGFAVGGMQRNWLKPCRAGGASDRETANAKAHAEKLMDAYFSLKPTATMSDLERVLRVHDEGFSWSDPVGSVKPEHLAARLSAGPRPTLESVALVVGADGDSVRGVWKATPVGGDGKPLYYAADIIHHVEMLGWSWRILRMTIADGDHPPSAPTPFCHLISSEIQ